MLVAMVLCSLQDAQCSQTAIANIATRLGQVANRAIQKIQRMDPNLIHNHFKTSQVAFEKIKTRYRWFQCLKEVIRKKKEANIESDDTHTSDLEMLNKHIQTCRPDTKYSNSLTSPTKTFYPNHPIPGPTLR